ncbi:MAG: hypothetical protein ACKOL0_00650 [Solirubrobacterales bacterium]
MVALVLTALAIGAGAAAIYISLTKNADSDRIDALETRIENLEAAAAGVAGTTDTTTEEPLPVTPATGGADSTVPQESTAPDAGVADEGASGGTQP